MKKSHFFDLEPSWKRVLEEELQKPYIAGLNAFLEAERGSGAIIFPKQENVFNAFWKTPFDQVRVLIIGQDPYHGQGQAHGLSFSVPEGVALPPSLRNIYKEILTDVGGVAPKHGCLRSWAEQGVMLLNATLTVREGEPKSHNGKGWERFTDAVVSKLSEREDPVIFVLWGNSAKEKCKHILQNKKNIILTAAHPSPFSAHRGFFGCRHFSLINKALQNQNKNQIKWMF